MIHIISRMFLSALLVLSLASRAAAQSEDEIKNLRREIETLKERQKTMEREVEGLKNVLRGMLAAQGRGREAPQPFAPVVVSVEGALFKGDKNAKVTLVDFSDYQ